MTIQAKVLLKPEDQLNLTEAVCKIKFKISKHANQIM